MPSAMLLGVMAWAWALTVASSGAGAAEGKGEFLRLGEGRCGLPILQREQVTSLHCAAICARDSRCEGFNVAAKRRETGLCEVTDNVTLLDLDGSFTCYVTERNSPPNVAMTTMGSTTTKNLLPDTSTTANPTTSIAGPMKLPQDLGFTGVKIIGLKDTSDSFLSFLYFSRPSHSPSPSPAPEPDVTPSVVMQGGGEQCAPGQVMVGIGSLDTRDSEKDDQRMFCSNLTDPMQLLTTCQQVLLGEGPRPMLQRVDTSAWINWLACPDNNMVTRLNWVYDVSAPLTEYRYSSALCCQVAT